MRVYTRSGDDGETGLLFGGRVSKTDLRCEAYGSTDQAVSAMGLARALSKDDYVQKILLQVQKEMFIVGSELSTTVENYSLFTKNFNAITSEMVKRIENLIDELDDEIDLPSSFIVPGASPASAALDMARSLLRTAERRVVEMQQQETLVNSEVLRYINRLSDLLFMLGRYEDKDLSFEIVTGDGE